MLSFVGLLSLSPNPSPGAGLKYFLVQRVASLLIVMSIFFSGVISRTLLLSLIRLSLCLKLAAGPFHGWLVYLSLELSWEGLFLVRTVQKILPLYLILQINGSWFGVVRRMRALAGILGGISESQLKKIFVYSSVLGVG